MAENQDNSSNRAVGRPPVKQREIINALHLDMIEGRLPPGLRLPTRRELVLRFGGSLMSIQHALDQLSRERFVETRGPAGTFVCQRPPHLFEYALVFAQTPASVGFRRFWTALSQEAQRLNAHPQATRHITCWYGIDGHADNEDFQRLTSMVQRRQMAGVIFASAPFLLAGTSLLEQPGIARAAITTIVDREHGVAVIHPDPISFLNRAAEHLASKGRRRVAVLSVPAAYESWNKHLQTLAKQNRFIIHPFWNLGIEPSTGAALRGIAHLLMHAGQDERPDGLIITDDNMLEPVTDGLIDAGVRVPDDLEIVAHCNFPWPTPSALPVCRLGFDASQVLAACLRAVDRQLAGHKPSRRAVNITARFESEVPINSPAIFAKVQP
jgi:DNA-binding LacI/PurR family transcriptional regulator